MASERPTVSESERLADWLDYLAAESVETAFACETHVRIETAVIRKRVRAAAARIRELEDALNVVRLACEHPANRTSHTQRQMVQFLEHLRKQVVSRLAHTESEDRND